MAPVAVHASGKTPFPGSCRKQVGTLDEEVSAYHEAGHAFMAICVGAQIHSVTIDPDWDDGPQRFGDAQIIWPAGVVGPKQTAEKRILVALAGPVAEMIHTGDPFHPGLVAEWSGDWNDAWKSSESLHADQQRRLACLESLTVQLYQALRKDEYWAAVASIADHLLAHETLEGEQVEEIVGPWLRWSSGTQ
jgi:ATP-dependent Zn protease